MLHDLRYSLRVIRKQPLFSVVAATVLALGVGINTAVFSVVSALLLRPLPADEPERLVYIYQTLPKQPDRPAVLWHGPIDHLREHTPVFAGLTGTWARALALTAAGETEMVHGEQVQAGYFEVLGVTARLGRTLLPVDSDPTTTEPAIVISHEFWLRRFDADPNVLGRQVRLTADWETDFTIVGVASPGFRGIAEPWTPSHFWIPAAVADRQWAIAAGRPGARTAFLAVGRLAPGVSLGQARAVVGIQAREYFADQPDRESRRFLVFPASAVRMPYDPQKAVVPTRLAAALTIVVLMVLLVAVANIAGILTARGVGRSAEIGVRRVLGAGGFRIARQLITESLLLALAGGIGGLLVAHWLVALFHTLTPLQYALDAAIDRRVAFFAAGICMLCGLLVGLAPAVQALRLEILPVLSNAGATPARQTHRRLRHVLVVPQVACSLVLLLVAAVYVRALMRVELQDPGYAPSNVIVVTTLLRRVPGERLGAMGAEAEPRAARARAYYQQLLARLQALPGIDAAATAMLPLSASAQVQWTVLPQEAYEPGAAGHPATRMTVSPGYFQTMGMQVLHGRDFDARDTRETPRRGIVAAALAERLWPGADPIGRSAALVATWPGSAPEVFEVLGVVNDISPVLHDEGTRPLVYVAMGQQWDPSPTHVVARGTDVRQTIEQVRSAVAAADPLADTVRTRTLSQMIAEILYPRRMAAAVLVASGVVALLLATIGIYGVLSYSVAQRLGEIGVRRALGADARDIARLVVGEGLSVAALGSAVGLVLGYAAIRVTSSRFLALPAIDVVTMLAVPVVLGAVVVLACALPARRAMRVDPMEVLRRS